MPTREERIEALSGAIETLLQKHKRLQLATVVLGATDAQSLDHPLRTGDYRHARTMLSAAVYQFAKTIVDDGENDDGNKRKTTVEASTTAAEPRGS